MAASLINRVASRESRRLSPSYYSDFRSTVPGLAIVDPRLLADPIEWCFSDRYLKQPNLYPRQGTFLKLVFLRDDLMTEYDFDVLGEWAEGFRLPEPGEALQHGFDSEDDFLRWGPSTVNGGLALGIQPDWETRLRICQEEGRSWFGEVIPLIGRRGSKGHLGGICGSYVLYSYMEKGDPQGHYGIAPDKQLEAIVFAGKKEQAKANQWRDLVNTILSGPYFRGKVSRDQGESLTLYAPNDFLRMEERMGAGLSLAMDMATFALLPKESTLMAGRGPTSFMLFFDEMAHVIASGANRSAEEVYDAAVPALDQFGGDGFIYTGSSPWQMIGKLYENYQEAMAVDAITRLPLRPERLMVQLASWDLYKDWDIAHTIPLLPSGSKTYPRTPMEAPHPLAGRTFQAKRSAIQAYNTQMKRLERSNPDTFRVERMSQWATALDAYLDIKKIEAMFAGGLDGAPLAIQEQGILSRNYSAHGDPSKCLTGDSLVFTDQGVMRLVQVEEGDTLVNAVGTDRVTRWIESGEKEVYRLRLKYGYEVRGSADHPVLTERGWVTLGDLVTSKGRQNCRSSDPKADQVQVRIGADLWSPTYVEVPVPRVPKRSSGRMCHPVAKVDERMGRLFGYISAEGHHDPHELTITAHVDEPICDESISLVRDLFGIEPSFDQRKGKARTVGWANTHLMLVLRELGITPRVRAAEKEVPWAILQSPRAVVQEYLRGYFQGDGTVSKASAKDRAASVTTASPELARQVQALLLNMGILAQRESYVMAYNQQGDKHRYWRINVRGEYLRRFANDVGFICSKKVARLAALVEFPVEPVPDDLWLPAWDVVSDGVEPTYDLTMASGHHNFVADGIVCHNSGDNFGFAIAHVEYPEAVSEEEWAKVIDNEHLKDELRRAEARRLPHVVFDLLHVWSPSDFPDGIIDYTVVEDQIIKWGKAFWPSMISFDQFNSVGTVQRVRRELAAAHPPRTVTVEERTATAPLNWKMAETFKTALNLGLVHAPYHELAELELRFLQMSRVGRVDHPSSGPVQSKDLADSMMNVVYDLIGDAMGSFIRQDLSDLKPSGSQAGGLPSSQVSQDERVFAGLSGFGRSPSGLPRARR